VNSERRSRPRLSIAIPGSIALDTPHLREKTYKLGLIGRAAAIFRVDEVVVYRDSPSLPSGELDFVKLILEYLDTPQYLRKTLFTFRPELKYAGILPPLRTPHHPVAMEGTGPFREGVVLKSTRGASTVDVGLDSPVRIPEGGLPVRSRITVKAEAGSYHLASRGEVPYYWGYRVVVREGVARWARGAAYQLVIATSRSGSALEEQWGRLLSSLKAADECLVLFGSPEEGLEEIVAREGRRLSDVSDMILNTVPGQGTATVRTEEALMATLAILNAAIAMKKP